VLVDVSSEIALADSGDSPVAENGHRADANSTLDRREGAPEDAGDFDQSEQPVGHAG
jgi:hypothetical protein